VDLHLLTNFSEEPTASIVRVNMETDFLENFGIHQHVNKKSQPGISVVIYDQYQDLRCEILKSQNYESLLFIFIIIFSMPDEWHESKVYAQNIASITRISSLFAESAGCIKMQNGETPLCMTDMKSTPTRITLLRILTHRELYQLSSLCVGGLKFETGLRTGSPELHGGD
jgi:hypothetical protein